MFLHLPTLTGWPTLTTFTPSCSSPATRLSTATLEAAVARMGRPSGTTVNAALMKRVRVRVLPVPGGLGAGHNWRG